MKISLSGKLSEGLRTAADVIVLSVLWSICSIPIVSIGAASAAMYRAMFGLLEGEGKLYRRFFYALRENWKQATVLWFLYALIGVLLYFNIYAASTGVLPGAEVMLICNGVIAAVWLLTIVYVFALEARFSGTLLVRLRSAAVLSIKRLPWSLLLIVLLLLPVLTWLFLTDLFWRTVVIWPLCGFGILFWVSTAIIRRLYLQEQKNEMCET